MRMLIAMMANMPTTRPIGTAGLVECVSVGAGGGGGMVGDDAGISVDMAAMREETASAGREVMVAAILGRGLAQMLRRVLELQAALGSMEHIKQLLKSCRVRWHRAPA
jgi:hypothetical protein